MTEVRRSIDIDAPVTEVWDTIMDPDRLHDWVSIHRALHSSSGGAPREGFEMDQTLALRGAPFRVHWKLVRCEPPHHAEWDGRGPARSHAETEYRLTSIDGGTRTRFDYRNVFTAPLGPLGAVASRALVGASPGREADASLARLRDLLEKRE